MQGSAPLSSSSSLSYASSSDPMRRCWALRVVVGPYGSLLGLTLRRRVLISWLGPIRWALCIISVSYVSSSDPMQRRWALHVAVVSYLSLLDPVRHRWPLCFDVGSYVSSLDLMCRRWVLQSLLGSYTSSPGEIVGDGPRILLAAVDFGSPLLGSRRRWFD